LTVTFVEGDILLSRAQVLGFGSNARGSSETTALATDCHYRYPAAYAAFRKQARAGRIHPGDWWVWREAAPWLGLLVVRQHALGATRPRYVETVAQTIAVNWQREGLQGIAIANLGEPQEWPALRAVLVYWLEALSLPVVVYEKHLPGVRAAEPWDQKTGSQMLIDGGSGSGRGCDG